MKLELITEGNYFARFVTLQDFEAIPKADNIQHAVINNNRVIVAKTYEAGTKGIYFPIECQINKELLSKNNLFENALINDDATKKGFFDKHGRVRAVKLRGAVSEGFFAPLEYVEKWLGIPAAEWDKVKDNMEFDIIDGKEVCKKYVVQTQVQNAPRVKQKGKVKAKSRILDGQFSFHYSTPRLTDNAHLINPDDIITISCKMHGSSLVSAKLLKKRKLSIWEKIKHFFGANVILSEYDYCWASRTVLKSEYESSHWYKSDIWLKGHQLIQHALEEKQTFYAELVGWTGPGGGMIQKGYSYGCQPGEMDAYVYRITTTEPDGSVYEWSMDEVVDFCARKGIKCVPIVYHGPAKELFADLDITTHWNREFIDRLKAMEPMEKDCPYCTEKVPYEGVCVRVSGKDVALKLKAAAFSERETKQLDKGEVDIESSESV